MTPEELRRAFSEIDDNTEIHIVVRKPDIPTDTSSLRQATCSKYKDYAVFLIRHLVNGTWRVATVWAVMIGLFPDVVPRPKVFVAKTHEVAQTISSSINYSFPGNNEPQSFVALDTSTNLTPTKQIPENGIVENITYYPISGVPQNLTSASSIAPTGEYYT